MKIIVQDIMCRNIEIECTPQTLIIEIKKKIEKITSIPVISQKILCNKKVVSLLESMETLNVNDGDVLHLRF